MTLGMSDIKLAWLAGFIDGDGSIQLVRSQNVLKPKVTIINTNDTLLNECIRILKLLNGREPYIYTQKSTSVKHKIRKQIIITKQSEIVHLLVSIYPHLVGKKEQAKLLMRFCTKIRNGYDEEDETITKDIQELNQRGDAKMTHTRINLKIGEAQ